MNENMGYSYLDEESETSYLDDDPYATSDVSQDKPKSSGSSSAPKTSSPDRLTSSGRKMEPGTAAYAAIYKFAKEKNAQVLSPSSYIKRQTLTEAGGWSYELLRQSDGTIDIFLLSSPECKLYQGQVCAPGMSVKASTKKSDSAKPAEPAPARQKEQAKLPTQDQGFPWAWAVGGLVTVGLIGGGIWWAVNRNSK